MEAKCGHLGRWWIVHVCLLIVLTQVESGFIDFRPGYEYIYRLNATADVVSVGKFLLRAKISYTNIQELSDSQELLLRVYGFQFSPIGQPDVRGHDFDFSSWFSFVITKHGVILRVYHDEDDVDEVIAIKKGIAGLLSAKLHSEDEVPGSTKGGHYSYTTEEVGHEGVWMNMSLCKIITNTTITIITTNTTIATTPTTSSDPSPTTTYKRSSMKIST
ncbi:hypothetical protein CHS0354_024510 [Potamilus streckersoni]|uniref:Uncharacterized protein n=1 Tax=Potamilus streckersoni TaxID=2493646 RepID=A0AAE0TPZ7_9BIVA|nr:hypothetical protein CHS0354_024510 [Potamilus streckersoni]